MRYAVDMYIATFEGIEEDGLVFDTKEEAEAKCRELNGEDRDCWRVYEYPDGDE